MHCRAWRARVAGWWRNASAHCNASAAFHAATLPAALPCPAQVLVLLRHGAFCDSRGRYLCPLARQAPAAFEEALGFEMRAAAQASASGYRRGGSSGRPGSMLGRLGPATSLGLAGVGFPTLDATLGASSVRESTVLDAALQAAAERTTAGGAEPHLNLLPFMSLAPHTVRPKTPASTGERGGAAPLAGSWPVGCRAGGERWWAGHVCLGAAGHSGRS